MPFEFCHLITVKNNLPVIGSPPKMGPDKTIQISGFWPSLRIPLPRLNVSNLYYVFIYIYLYKVYDGQCSALV